MLRQSIRLKWQGGRIKHGRTHIDGDLPVWLGVQGDDAALHLHADRGFGGEPLLKHKAHKAACAIAAVLNHAAIGVVDDVGKIHIGRGGWAHRQNLVCAHAKAPVGNETVLFAREVQRGAGFVQHHKVVACALHFGKGNKHGQIMAYA